jgi:hypothetical protein
MTLPSRLQEIVEEFADPTGSSAESQPGQSSREQRR